MSADTPDPALEEIARIVRTRRNELHLSHEALAARAGMNFKTVMLLEHARHRPRARTREALELALGLPAGTLTPPPTRARGISRTLPGGSTYEITPTPDGAVRVRATSPGGEPVELELPDAEHAIALARDLLNVATGT